MNENIVHKDYITFNIKGNEIMVISDEINGIYNTVVEINNILYYLENEEPNILAAIFAWEYSHKELLSKDELNKIMNDNFIL